MAFDPNQQDPNNPNGQPQQPNGMVTPPMTSSAPGSGPGSSTGKATPQSTPAQPFQNLQAYLGANQPQVTAQANKIAGDLTNQYGQTKSSIDQGKTDFSTQVKSGYTQDNPDLVKGAVTNTTDFANDPNNVKAFQSLYNDSYTGPANFEGTDAYGNLSGKVNTAVTNANQIGTNEGLQNYFQSQNQNATKGGNVLDSVLLQTSPDAYSTVQNAAKPYNDLTGYLTNATTAADQEAIDAQNAAQGISTNVRNQFTGEGGVIPTFQSGINQRVDQTKTALQTAYDSAVNALKNGQPLTAEQASVLGTRPEDLQSFTDEAATLNKDYGVPFDINSYVQQNVSPDSVNAGNVASKEDYAKAAALSQLTGEDLSSFLNPGNVAQAGTAPTSLGSFNNQNAFRDVSENLTQKDNDFLQTHPVGTITSKEAPVFMDIVSRNPSMLNDPYYSKVYNQFSTKTPNTVSTGTPTPPKTGDIRPDPTQPNQYQQYNGTTGQWEHYTQKIFNAL